MEEQAILRYKAEHGGTFQQARAAVIVDTPRAVSSRTYAQATKLSLKSSKPAQPKASDKVTASVTSKANAQRHTPPSSPKASLSRPADKPRARKPSKEGAPREPVSRFGNVSDMDIDSISDYLSDERNYEELKLLLSRTYTPIVALQDCKLGEEQLSLRRYTLLRGNCPAGEAALLINQQVVHTELTLNSLSHAVAATITLDKIFNICSIYLTPGETITKLNLENLLYQLPRPFLLLGDFNAHSPVWGDSRRDGRGKLIESFLQDNDLILLNFKSPTFVPSAYNSTSAIDLAVASPTIALDFQWSVHDELCGSNHFPIFITSHAEDNTTHPRYNFTRLTGTFSATYVQGLST